MTTNVGPSRYPYDEELVDVVPTMPVLDLDDPTTARETAAAFGRATGKRVDLTDLEVVDHDLDGLRVRVYRPRQRETPTAAVLYIHGGGFVLGSIAAEEANATELVRRLGVTLVSVDYRLAPEHRYPAAIDDCTAALRWLHANAPALAIDPERIAVYGHSAGGALAAALALRSRDGSAPPLRFQFLGMPVLDDRLATPSVRQFVDTVGWNRSAAQISWRHYLGDRLLETPDVPYDAAPARATDLRGLPPAYITAMEFDPLRDEAIDYAQRLFHAGVSVELHVFAGAFHGSMHVAATGASRRAADEEIAVLRRALRSG